MEGPHRVGEIEVAQDLAFQRREWALQRVLWVAIAVLLLAGLAGLFGSGPLSHAETGTAALSLEYERLARLYTPSELKVRIGPGAATDGTVVLWLDRAFLDTNKLEAVLPEPEDEEAGGERVIYRFAVAEPGSPIEVTFELEPERVGRVEGRVGLVEGPELAFGQFVYP